jgi:parallel beta-helix repeat protein
VAVVACTGLIGHAASASGEARYTAVQCYPGVGSEDHSSAEFSGRHKYGRVSCSGQGLGLSSRRRTARGRRGQWTIAAPKGTRFSFVSLESRQRGGRGWFPDADVVGAGGILNSIPQLPADGDWHGGWTQGSFHAVVSRLVCLATHWGHAPRARSSRPICGRTRRPFVYSRQFRFNVVDFSPPNVSNPGGSMLSAGIKSGPQSVTASASDLGGGLSQVFLRVNGVPTAARSFHCDLASLRGSPVGDRLSPCPSARTENLTTNVSAAPFKQGANVVQACAADHSDSAGQGFPANTTCSAPQTVTVGVSCDRVAATSGRDGSAGTVAAPWKTAQYMVDRLGFGQTGCLRAGTFASDSTIEVRRPGIMLASYPGERATLRGELKLEKGADGVTVRNLNLDGRSTANIGPMVFASNATFDNDDVTNYHTGICFILGAIDPAYGRAVNTVIENSRIHDCGSLPAQNGDHGFYVEHSDGAIIRNNFIYDNADRGIQLYPDSQGTQVYGNVIDGNGEGIIISSDGSSRPSSNNLVFNNVISNSKLRWNVESSWPNNRVGTGNVVRNNCLWSSNSNSYYNARGGVIGDAPLGFTASGNVVAAPQFVNRFSKDFRLQANSPCAFIYL